MPRSSRWMGPVLAACALTAVGFGPSSCGDVARIQVQLQPSSRESSASGEIWVGLHAYRSILRLSVRHLDPESEYLLLADGVERTRFTTNPGGNAYVTLSYPPNDEDLVLDFDPRGKLLSVSDGSEDKLSAVVSGPLEPPGIQVWEVAGIPATAEAEGGRVEGTYWTLPNTWRTFEVRLRNVAPGTYQVLIDGALVGEVEADAGGYGVIRFWSTSQWDWLLQDSWRPGGLALGSAGAASEPLSFEPRGARVELVRDGEVLYAGPMRARVALPEEADACPAVDLQALFTRVRAVGSGEASMVSEDGGCDHEFQVTVRQLAAANYELWVGGAMVGTVPVRNWSDGLRGVVRFDTNPDDPDELPLEFDPRGQPIEVRRQVGSTSVLYLEALFPTG